MPDRLISTPVGVRSSAPVLVWMFIAITLACVAVASPVFDFDLYWHLAFGREIWNSGTIIQHDVFSYTAEGIPFVNRYWLAQWIFYGLQHHVGWSALPILKLIIAAIIVVLMFQTALFMKVRPWVAGLTIPLCILIAHYRFTERPELFTLLFMAALAYLLIGWRTGRLPSRMLWLIPPLMLVWDWLHGGIFGLIYLMAVVVVENVLARADTRYAARPAISTLNWVLLASASIMLLNPFGLATYGEYFSHLQGLGDPAVSQVAEYQPITWQEFRSQIILLLLWGMLTIASWKQVPLPHVFASLGFVFLSTMLTRIAGVAMILVAPLLAASISRLIDHDDRRRFVGQVCMTMVGVGLLWEGYTEKFRHPPTPRSFGWGVAERYFPVGAARLVRDLDLQGNFFNSGHFGGYLAWELYPQRRVFHYNHGSIFGDTYRYWGRPELLDKYDLQYAFIGNRQDAKNFPPQEWAAIYREAAGALVVRRKPENADLIQRLELRIFHPRMTNAELMQGASQNPERMFEEMINYLAYRTDERVAEKLVLLLDHKTIFPRGDVGSRAIDEVVRRNPRLSHSFSAAKQR